MSLFYKLTVYGKKTSCLDLFRFACHSFYEGEKKPFYYFIKNGKTIRIDLSQSASQVLSQMKQNTRNEIRRGIRDCYIFSRCNDVDFFINYYNRFASEKKLSCIKKRNIAQHPEVMIFQCERDDKVLAMHANIIDRKNKISSLLYSASIRFDENVERKSVGVANRFLHYKEFEYFIAENLLTYDFSGICDDPNQKEEYNIFLFKSGFGGEIVPTVTLYSPLMKLYKLLKK